MIIFVGVKYHDLLHISDTINIFPGKIKIEIHDTTQIMLQMKHLMFSIYIFCVQDNNKAGRP